MGFGGLDEYTFKMLEEISVEGSAGEAVKILLLVEFIKKLKG